MLIPPPRSETTKGILWWKKSTIVFHATIPNSEQALSSGISIFRALASEFPNRRGIDSISAIIVGGAEAALHAYKGFTNESESNERISKWLLEEVPCFTLSFETPEGEIIRSLDYETVDGQRVVSTSRSMNADEEKSARERAKAGLEELLREK